MIGKRNFKEEEEEEVNEKIVKCEQPDPNSDKVSLSERVHHPTITQRCLKKELPDSDDKVECPCEECTGKLFIPESARHQIKVKFDAESESAREETIPDDNIDSFFGDEELPHHGEMSGNVKEERPVDDPESDTEETDTEINSETRGNVEQVIPNHGEEYLASLAAFSLRRSSRATQRVNYRVPDPEIDLADVDYATSSGEQSESETTDGDLENELSDGNEAEEDLLEESNEATARQLRPPAASSTGKPFKCSTCQATFRFQANLTVHQLTHQAEAGPRPYMCAGCGVRYKTKGHLTAHKKSQRALAPYRCTECKATFTQGCHLRKHIRQHRMTPSSRRPFKCPTCKKAFAVSCDLLKHRRTHSGERPFKCPHPGCGNAFAHNDNLAKHLLTHDPSLENSHQCGCGKAFAQRRYLRQHQRLSCQYRDSI